MILKLFSATIFSLFFFSLSLFAKWQPYVSAELDGLFSMGLRSSKNGFIVFSNDEIFSGGYQSYRPISLRFSSESKLEAGLVWRGDGRLTGHSFFGIYQISYIDLLHASFSSRLFDDYWSLKKISKPLEGYSDYLLPNLERFLLHWKQLPLFDLLVSPKQLNNQAMVSYNYSILNSLDIATAFAFSSFLPEEDLNAKKSDSFNRTELYTFHFNIFFRPLLLIPQLNFEDELEATLFFTYGLRSMPNAYVFFDDTNNLVRGVSRRFSHDEDFFRGEFGLFHSKELDKLGIDSFFQYEHQLFLYGPRISVEKISENNFLLTTKESIFRNIMKASFFTSFNFSLPQDRYVGPKRLPTEFVLSLGYSFTFRNSDVGLWEYDECGCLNDSRFPNFFNNIATTPVAIVDSRLLDYFKHQTTTELEYHFYRSVSFFVMYQFSFFDYSKLFQLIGSPRTLNISSNDDKQISHALKVGFRFFNSFIENIEPYFLFSRSTFGRLIPKENLDFLGVGIKFSYRLDTVSR